MNVTIIIHLSVVVIITLCYSFETIK